MAHLMLIRAIQQQRYQSPGQEIGPNIDTQRVTHTNIHAQIIKVEKYKIEYSKDIDRYLLLWPTLDVLKFEFPFT